MNEVLQTQIASIVEKGTMAIETVVNNLMTQAPELVKEILWYNAIISAIWFILLLGFTLLLTKWEKQIWQWGIKTTEERDDPVFLLSVLYSIIHLVIISVLCAQTTWIKILVAPRLYLLEYVAQLI